MQAAINSTDITLYGDGQQTRTFCFVDDNIESTIKILESGKANNDTLNIGSDQEITILDLAKLIIRLTGSSSKIVHLPPLAEGDMTRRQPDIFKMKEILNRPLITLEEGIRKMLQSNSNRRVNILAGEHSG